jgi:hypothetical protein
MTNIPGVEDYRAKNAREGKALFIPGRSVEEVRAEMAATPPEPKLNYIEPPGPGGHRMQVSWSEHEAECIETALDSATQAIAETAVICAHVHNLITNAAPSPVPRAAASILHMTFLALDTLTHRECETLSEAETRIRLWRKKAVADREWEEEEQKRKGGTE